MVEAGPFLDLIFSQIEKKYPSNIKQFAADIGIKETVLYSMRTNQTYPSLNTFEKICRGLGLSADELLGLDTRPDLRLDERDILQFYNSLPSNEQKRIFYEMADSISEIIKEWIIAIPPDQYDLYKHDR